MHVAQTDVGSMKDPIHRAHTFRRDLKGCAQDQGHTENRRSNPKLYMPD